MLANLTEMRTGAVLASLADLIPHRGSVQQEGTQAPLDEQALEKLRGTYFSGMTLVGRGRAPAGVLVHFSGRLSHAFVDAEQGVAALHLLRSDRSLTQFSSRRIAHPILMAASALFDGELSGSWSQLSHQQLTDLNGGLPSTFTGVLAWVGNHPHVCVFHGGRLFSQSTLPDASTPGPILHVAAQPTPPGDLLGPQSQSATPSAPGPEPVPVADHAQRAEPAELNRIWQATLEVYSARLGRAARPATQKLQNDLAGLEPAAALSEIRKRLTLAFGPEAVSALEHHLGGQ